MSWQGEMSTVLRYLVDDINPAKYKYADTRIETTLLVAAQIVTLEVDFPNTYTINVEQCTLSPDPTDDTKDNAFINLVCLKAACIMVGSEIRSESGNAISIKDGPSAIDLRGVTQNLNLMYKDFCAKYDSLLKTYQYNNTLVGQAILGPYSPGSMILGANQFDYRGNVFD